MIPSCAAPEKPQGTTVDHFLDIEPRGAVHLAAKAQLRIFVGADDSGFRLTQTRQYFLCVVSDG
jgi:hypothetical protein